MRRASLAALRRVGCRAVPRSGARRTCGVINLLHSGTPLGRATRGGESPVREMRQALLAWYLSTVGHEKSCGNLGGPSSKAEYEIATDSEEVP